MLEELGILSLKDEAIKASWTLLLDTQKPLQSDSNEFPDMKLYLHGCLLFYKISLFRTHLAVMHVYSYQKGFNDGYIRFRIFIL